MAISKFNYNSFNVTPVASKALAFDADADGFTTASGSSMILIKTLTASSSGTLSFVNGSSDVVLDDTYPVYKFEFINMHPQTNDKGLQVNVSIDTGSNYNVAKTTTFFRAYHYEHGNEGGLAYQTAQDLAQGTGFQDFTEGGISNDNDCSLSGEFFLFSPSNTTFVKHFMGKFNLIKSAAGGVSINSFVAGYANTTSAVDAVQFKMNAGNIDAGKIKLYGISD
mgnify:FL=1